MQKLTKGQADTILGLFKAFSRLKREINHDDIPDSFVAWENIVSAVRQCSAKEFPQYNGVGDEDDIAVVLSRYEGTPIRMDIISRSNPNNDNDCVYFSKEEFKQFTEGCNKIVEWLDEQ